MQPKYLSKYNKYRISNLFIETANRDVIYEEDSNKDMPVFCLHPEDIEDSKGNKYISMHRLFLEAGDMTGYDFAVSTLGSYEHFVKLSEHKIIGTHIAAWITEIKAKLDSKSIKDIERIAKDGGSQAELAAAKYLANREYEPKSSKAGKPATNNNERKNATQAKILSRETKEEMVRLGISVVE